MRITVCELPHEPEALAAAWTGLCHHTVAHRSELVLLPEFALVEPVWEEPRFDQAQWDTVVEKSDAWLQRLPELGVTHVVGARPVSVDRRPFNQGYLWSAPGGLTQLRRKFFMPDEPGGWESHWFDRGDSTFPAFHAGGLTFGLNICTEMWALETYGAYAEQGVQVILAPRATAAATTTKWMSVGIVAAVRAGAFNMSSNRVDPTGTYGGVGWIISPQGQLLAATSAESPFATVDVDLAIAATAQAGYPCSVFSGERALSRAAR